MGNSFDFKIYSPLKTTTSSISQYLQLNEHFYKNCFENIYLDFL